MKRRVSFATCSRRNPVLRLMWVVDDVWYTWRSRISLCRIISIRATADISAPIVANVIPEAALRSRRLCRSSIASSLHRDRVRVHAAFAWYDRRTRRRAANFSIARTTYARLSRLESSIDPRSNHRGMKYHGDHGVMDSYNFLPEQRKIRNLFFDRN